MTKEDVASVGEVLYKSFNEVAARYGYAPKFQTAKEAVSLAWRLSRHHPAVLLVAEVDHRIAGLCCMSPRGAIAGIGPVAVDPEFQGRRIGHDLVQGCIDRAEGVGSIRLFQEAYNPGSFSLYYTLGFRPVSLLLDLFHQGNSPQQPDFNERITQFKSEDLDDLLAYDKSRSESDRIGDLKYYLNWGKIFVVKVRTEIQGYLACLPAQASVMFGPLVAESDKDAGMLFQHAMGAFEGKSFMAKVMARDRELVENLKAVGYKIGSLSNLLVRGSWRPGEYVEGFGMFPEGI